MYVHPVQLSSQRATKGKTKCPGSQNKRRTSKPGLREHGARSEMKGWKHKAAVGGDGFLYLDCHKETAMP